MAYTKLHQSLVTSTVWREPHHIRLAWISMMALASKEGEVMASIPGLADVCRITIPEMEEALKCFLSPDPYSRTKDCEGRRIEEIDGGWWLINHDKYRAMASKEDAKMKASARTARYRAKKASHTVDSNGVSTVNRDIAEAKSKEQRAEKKPRVSEIGRKKDSPESSYPDFILTLWNIFPPTSRGRSSKKKIFDHWKATRDKPENEFVISELTKWASSEDWTKDGGQFAPGAHLWIKDRKWESDAPSVSKPAPRRIVNFEP